MTTEHDHTNLGTSNAIVAALKKNYYGTGRKKLSWAKWYSKRSGLIAMVLAAVAVTGILVTYQRLGLLHQEVEELQIWMEDYSHKYQEERFEDNDRQKNLQALLLLLKQNEEQRKTLAKDLQALTNRIDTSITRLESTQRSTTTLVLERLGGLSQAIATKGHNGAKAVEALSRLLGTTGDNQQYAEWRPVGQN